MLVIGFFLVVFGIIGTIIANVFIEKDIGAVYVVGAFIAIFLGIWTVILLRECHDDKKKEVAEAQKYYDEAYQDVDIKKKEIEKEGELIPGRIEADERTIKDNLERIAAIKQLIPIKKKESDELQQKAETLYNALVKSYGAFFHPDNWQNLDRVVYYLSTGRAETLREALNLMDQRLNAEMIANEIRASSNMIANEIRQSTQETVFALGRCADVLATAVYSVGNSINSTIQDLGERIGENTRIGAAQVAATNRLVSAQELNNSLQRQSNRTMEQMLSDYQVVNNRVHYS